MHEPRLALLHSPRFRDYQLTMNFLNDPVWRRANPEIVIVREGLLVPHFIDRELKHQHYFSASFNIANDIPYEEGRWDALDEAAAYATHLLAFVEDDDDLLKRFLCDKDRPKRPTRLVMV